MNYITKCRLWLEAIEGLEAYIKAKLDRISQDNYYSKDEKDELIECYNDILLTLEAVLKNDIE